MSQSPLPADGADELILRSPTRSFKPQPTEVMPPTNMIDLTLDSDEDEITEIPRIDFFGAPDFVKKESEEPVGISEEITKSEREAKGEIFERIEMEGTLTSAIERVTPRVTTQVNPEKATNLGDVAPANTSAGGTAPENIAISFIPPTPLANRPLTREERIARDQALEDELRNGIDIYYASLNSNAPASIPATKADAPGPSSNASVQVTAALTPTPVESEAEDAVAAAEFQAIKKKYDQMVRDEDLDLEDEVEFKRAQQAEQVRLRLLERKRAYVDREDSNGPDNDKLFFSDNESSSESPLRDAAPESKHPAKKQRQNGATSISAKQLERSQQMGLDDAISKARKHAGSKKVVTSKAADRRKNTMTRVSKPKGRKEKTPGQSGKGKKGGRRVKSPQLANIASLLNNDIVRDAHANFGREKQPGFTSKNRKEALAELMASIPEEHRKPYASDKKHLDDACKKFTYRGQGSMGSDGSGNWRLKGMNTSLYHYQLLGVAWMRDRENSASRPYGGLVADTMGFGKTVMMLANALDGQPAENSRNKTTLIVCPSTLCTQWLSEIQKHVNTGLLGEVVLFRAGARLVTDDVVRSLSKCGIVITTYHEVLKNYPFTAPPAHLVNPETIKTWWEQHYAKEKGPLFRINWHRIILDEAQIIKNHEGRISRAIRSLHGKFRWALSGTPIQNGIEEFYSFFDFLQVDNTGSYSTFKHNFCSKLQKSSMNRLHSFLRKIMLRRTSADEMFGRPILSLPSLSHETIPLNFSKLERAIYHIVKARFVAKINEWSLGRQIEKRYNNMFVMLLRLRQICAHVLLVQSAMADLLENEDLEKLWKLTEQETEPGSDSASSETLTVLRKMFAKHKPHTLKPGEEAPDAGIEVIGDSFDYVDTGGSFGTAGFKFRKCLRQLHASGQWEEINKRSLCHKCRMPAEEPHLAVPCEHLYCKECATVLLYEATQNEVTRASCVECGTTFDKTEPCVAFEQAAFNIDGPAVNAHDRKRKGSTEVEGNEFGWLALPGPPLPSTKTRAVKAQLLNWFEEDPHVKVIVFTQFLGMVRILSRVCVNEGWEYCTLTGTMTPDSRDRNITTFRTDPEKRVLLASLKAGSLGLNLTCASKVMLLDPWWNQSVEDQAYSRIYRIGQEKGVDVRRFMINDTVDTQLLMKMQERKNLEIDKAIGEKAQKSNLSVQELMRLFGPVIVDEETGLPLLEAEDTHDEFIFVEDQHHLADAEEPQQAIPPPPF